MALPPIVAKITAETSGLTKGLGDAQTRLATFAKIGAAATAAVAAGVIALTKASLANIDVLAKQARSIGLATDAFQRMALVAEEAGVEAGQLSQMLGLMQRAADSGHDAFGRLGISIAEIQGLNPDEQFARVAEALSAITDPTEKTAIAMDIFGRSGRAAINMLEDYRAKADEARQFQERFGIAVGQTASDQVEAANDAVGRLGMVMQGLGNRIAVYVAPAIELAANKLIDLAGALIGVRNEAERLQESLERNLLDVTQSVVYEIEQMAEVFRYAGNVAAAEMIDTIVSGMDSAIVAFTEGRITAEEFAAQIDAARAQSDALVSGLSAVDQAKFSGVIGQLAKLWDSLSANADEAARLAANIPGDFEMAPSDGSTVTGFEADTNAPTMRPRRAPATDALGGSRGGGGGGGGNPLQDRLEALMEGLATEREILATWYEESQLTLEDALAAKMLTEQEYMDARERLEQEHQDRLGQIRDLANQGALSAVLSAGEEILGALGATNKKALRVAKVFGAAQALISAYQGAAEALKLPFPKNLAAAASVLAKGIGFVQAIKGVNESGGGGGTGGGRGGAGGGGAAAQAPVQTLNFTLTNDPFGFGEKLVRQLASQLNEATRNGASIRATVAT